LWNGCAYSEGCPQVIPARPLILAGCKKDVNSKLFTKKLLAQFSRVYNPVERLLVVPLVFLAERTIASKEVVIPVYKQRYPPNNNLFHLLMHM
jgi:hypothetical protein